MDDSIAKTASEKVSAFQEIINRGQQQNKDLSGVNNRLYDICERIGCLPGPEPSLSDKDEVKAGDIPAGIIHTLNNVQRIRSEEIANLNKKLDCLFKAI